ncbi:MAG: PqqD family peptide modification chaperone [Geminicoccaceae bacterium]|nr:MAG: PqqD family peptide modification chaperone [Geminicoccaceae bacterium]
MVVAAGRLRGTMQRPPFSQNWYRVAHLRPRLRAHAEVHRQRFRGQTWYVVQDHQGGRFHRLAPAAYFVVCMMDGQRSMRTIWQLVEERFKSEVPSQDDVIRLLAQLHAADLLVGQDLPDLAELDRRAGEIERRTLLARIRNPMALRFPLLDPDRFITATLPLVGWLFSPLGALLWLGLIVAGLVHTALAWPALSTNLADRVLSAENILLMLLVYPVIKAVHELGHAYAVKRWGGEVHELGLMLLVLLPVPYVDASASLAFREWWRRAVVAGAGILVELALAALAIIAWTYTEPGLVRALLFNVALIAGVSTLLFNGNPLLRFDGYYVLSDALGIPNLATRGNRYLGYLVQRYAFGVATVETPVVTPSERGWLAGYAIASFVYRIAVMVLIALFIASQLFVVGVLLAMWVVVTMLVWPVLKGLGFVLSAPVLDTCRRRAVGVTAGAVAILVGLVAAVPLPHATVAQAVIWLPPGSVVRAGTVGEVVELLAAPGSTLAAGDPLLRLDDPQLDAMIRVQTSHLRELQARFDSVDLRRPLEAQLIAAALDRAAEELARLEERRRELIVRAPRAGHWVVANDADLVGRFVGRGEVLGHVLQDEDRIIRAVVDQATVDLVRERNVATSVRLAPGLATAHDARIVREVPGGDRSLPSLALTTQGGGRFALDPTATGGPATLEPVFQFELQLEDVTALARYAGVRAHVRFDHGKAPLLERGARSLRQLFLRHFDV